MASTAAPDASMECTQDDETYEMPGTAAMVERTPSSCVWGVDGGGGEDGQWERRRHG